MSLKSRTLRSQRVESPTSPGKFEETRGMAMKLNRKTQLLTSTIVAAFLLLTTLLALPISADNLATPPAFVLTHQVSLVGPQQPGNPFGVRVGLEDFFNQGGQFVNIFEHGYVGINNPNQTYLWSSFVGSIPARAYLPPCASPTDSPCIESVSTKAQGESIWQFASVSSSQPQINYGVICEVCTSDYGPFAPIPFDKTKQYGGVPSMWSLPSAPHGGGSDYRVDVQLNQKTQGNSCGPNPCTFIQIVPLQLGPSKSFDTIRMPSSPVGRGVDFRQFEFPKNLEFRIVLRLEGAELLQPDGFFFGRVENLDITSSPDDMKRLTISGTPMRVPFAQISGVPLANLPDHLLKDLDPNLRNIWSCKVVDVESCIMQFSSSSNNPLLYDFSSWENFGLKTIASGTMWEVRATNPPSTGNCANLWVSHGLTGTLSTNSTVYSADVPQWDPVSQSFTYTVASTHLDESGAKNRGFYELALKSDLVSCLWGKTASAANAVVQIVSEDGTTQVATTDVHEQGGIFYFTAANFEYSKPRLKVTFVKPIKPTATPIPSATPLPILTPTPKPKSKIVITCMKGKVVKKVTSVKPVCPNGYKKK